MGGDQLSAELQSLVAVLPQEVAGLLPPIDRLQGSKDLQQRSVADARGQRTVMIFAGAERHALGGDVAEVPELARVTQLQDTNGPGLLRLLHLVTVIDAQGPIVPMKIVAQRGQVLAARCEPALVLLEKSRGDLLRDVRSPEPDCLGQKQGAIGQMFVGVLRAADVFKKRGELPGLREGFLLDRQRQRLQRLDAPPPQSVDVGPVRQAVQVDDR